MHPVLFTFHSLTVYSYGLLVATGMLVVFCLAVLRAPRLGFSKNAVSDLVLALFVSGVVGARFFYVLQHVEEYSSHPMKVFSIQEGGLVWYGGFIFAMGAGFVYAGVRRLPALRLFDFFAPFTPLAHAIGRLGCFLNGCCFGRFTESPFGVLLPGEAVKRLPVQIIEAIFLFLLSGFLFALSYKKRREGELFICYVALYSAGRFILEFWRGDQLLVFSLTIPQWSSVFLFGAAAASFIILRRKRA